MARTPSRRELYLMAGLGVAVLAWMISSDSGEAPQVVAARKAQEKAVVLGKAPVVHMEMLEKSVVAYDAKGRDVFKYSQRPPSMAEYRRRKAEQERLRREAEAAAEAARIAAERAAEQERLRQIELAKNPPPPPPPVPPPITFEFLGYVGPAHDRIAAFEENNQTFVAKTGDVVKSNFKIQEIRYESVIIAYVDPRFKGQSRELALSRGR
jgi:hypothetical protein